MKPLTIDDLLKLEDYAAQRAAFRRRVLDHKKDRTVALGEHLTLVFEDRLTIQYQVQEMLRIERTFERAAIQDELDAYNPLIPTGTNWKATCLIEYPDVEERRRQLAALRDVERRIWVQVGDGERIEAIADEDLPRSTDEKTSAVHFLRFELDGASLGRLRDGAELHLGVAHPRYGATLIVPEATRQALLADLD